MRKNFKCIVLFAILFSALFSISAAEVVVSPKMRSLSYSMQTTPDSLAVQLGLDSQSLILSTDTDTVTAQLQLDRLVAISDPGYVLVPGDTISVSYMERTGTNPVTLHITIPYGGTIRISSIATVETAGRTFQSVRSEIEAILTQYNRYANPIITIQSLGLFHVSINGEVTSSRSIRVNGNSFLSDVLYYGASTASSRLVTIKSADGTERSYDPYLGMRRGESSNNPRLQPGDVITLHKKDRAVTISGAVNDKGTYQLLEGENLFSWRKKHCASMSVIFQNYTQSVDPSWTVREILSEPVELKCQNLSGDERKYFEEKLKEKSLRDALQSVGLDEDKLNRFPHELSGGELQRVCIARALIAEPKLVIFDEALSSLDASIQGEIVKLLKKLPKRDSAWLFISHDIKALTALCDRILFLHDGQIIESIAKNDLFKARHPVVRQMIEAAQLL